MMGVGRTDWGRGMQGGKGHGGAYYRAWPSLGACSTSAEQGPRLWLWALALKDTVKVDRQAGASAASGAGVGAGGGSCLPAIRNVKRF